MIPIIPLPGKVILPRVSTPLNVVRKVGVLATKFALQHDKTVLLLNQKKAEVEDPQVGDFHEIGTIARLADSFEPGDGTIRIAVEAERRGLVLEIFYNEGFFLADVDSPTEDWNPSQEVTRLRKTAIKRFSECMQLRKKFKNEVHSTAKREKDPGVLADYIANHADLKEDKPQQILDKIDPIERLESVIRFLEEELEVSELDRRIDEEVKKSVERTHKEFYLNERIKAIQKELGRGEDGSDEIDELRKQIEEAGMSEEAVDKATKELNVTNLFR